MPVIPTNNSAEVVLESKKKTQAERVLGVLMNANGGWVCGEYFLQNLCMSQFHARIFELKKRGHEIQASTFVSERGFKSYRLKQTSNK